MRQQISGRWFQWDDKKAQKNFRKHDVRFEEAALVFDDENRIEEFDNAHSGDEDRWKIIGMVHDILCVVYTERGEDIRLITARKATPKERRDYNDGKKIY